MISIKVPPLGESIVEATVARWLKKDGDAVTAGETLVELETDKITVEVPALKGGVLARRAANEGDVVKVDQLLGEIDENASAAATPAAAPAGAPAGAPAPRAAPPTPVAGGVSHG
ncbi:MAG TPA: biotin/lipoyl-containing protein, partial [Gemmatimonadaceae bacterium]|nr:biotin/lipoyl-containing protein [Gemmatimonadaceae bacterium]